MRLRLAVVAVALLVSFGAQAGDTDEGFFGISIKDYIDAMRQSMRKVELLTCENERSGKENKCIYSINDKAEVIISEDVRQGKIVATAIYCNNGEACDIVEIIKTFMKTSPTLLKHSTGWNGDEIWENLINESKLTKQWVRREDDASIGFIIEYYKFNKYTSAVEALPSIFMYPGRPQ